VIADLCEQLEVDLHVDAAWAGAACLSPRLRPLLDGIDRADSVTIDAHKWLSASMGAGMFLTRHAQALSQHELPLEGERRRWALRRASRRTDSVGHQSRHPLEMRWLAGAHDANRSRPDCSSESTDRRPHALKAHGAVEQLEHATSVSAGPIGPGSLTRAIRALRRGHLSRPERARRSGPRIYSPARSSPSRPAARLSSRWRFPGRPPGSVGTRPSACTWSPPTGGCRVTAGRSSASSGCAAEH
jgi:Pyridoxal-dependent decarboxylase conserved domain